MPNAELPNWPLGLLNCAVFSTLNISRRSSELTGPIFVFLISDASMFRSPGPRRLLRLVLPNVPVVSVVCTKQDVLNHCKIVGFERTGSQVWFGRLLVMPVESMLCDWVIWNGMPDRRKRMPLTCQPPHARDAAHGSS